MPGTKFGWFVGLLAESQFVFVSSFKSNAGIPRLGNDSFLPSHFQFISHHTTQRYIVRVNDSDMKFIHTLHAFLSIVPVAWLPSKA
jgi:hypothetical protein